MLCPAPPAAPSQPGPGPGPPERAEADGEQQLSGQAQGLGLRCPSPNSILCLAAPDRLPQPRLSVPPGTRVSPRLFPDSAGLGASALPPQGCQQQLVNGNAHHSLVGKETPGGNFWKQRVRGRECWVQLT